MHNQCAIGRRDRRSDSQTRRLDRASENSYSRRRLARLRDRYRRYRRQHFRRDAARSDSEIGVLRSASKRPFPIVRTLLAKAGVNRLDRNRLLWQIVLPMRVCALVASIVLTCAGATESSAGAEQNFSATQAILGSSLHLFVPVSINGGKRIWWLVDTGAPGSTISPSLRRALSLPGPAAGSGINAAITRRGKTYPVAFAQSVDINGTELGPGYFRVEQTDRIASEKTNAISGGFEKGGIIGMNFLLKHGALINYKTLQIFLSRQDSRLPVTREGYKRMGYTYVPLHISPRGYVEVEGTIGGSTYSFLLDTGSFVGMLEPKIRERNHLAFNETRAILTAPYAGIKNVRLTQTTIPGFRIGTQDLSNYRIGFSESHTFDPGFVHEYGGILGPDLLHYHEALIDLGNRALYLKPDRRDRKK
jgi:predicted aspartyl protease